jgi:tetratricopeptide (TPR) repeat protein
VTPDPGDSAPPTIATVLAAARRGDFRVASQLADALADQTPPGSPEALRLVNIRGGIAFERGELGRAEAWFEEAIRLANDLDDPQGAAKAANNLGSIAHLRGKNVLAASLYAGALEIHRAAGDLVGEAQTEHNLGLVHRQLGEYELAQSHADRAIAAARATEDSGLLALALTGAVAVAISRGNLRCARRTLVGARAFARASGEALNLLEVRRLQALLALRACRPDVALAQASEAYLAAHRLGSLHLAGECAALCAQAARQLERQRLARGFRARARECFLALGAVEALRRLAGESAA